MRAVLAGIWAGFAPYVVGAVLVLLVASHALVGWRGYQWAAERCEAETLRGKIAGLERDLRVAREAEAARGIRAAEDALQINDMKVRADDYEAELGRRPNRACALDDADVRSLRALPIPRRRPDPAAPR